MNRSLLFAVCWLSVGSASVASSLPEVDTPEAILSAYTTASSQSDQQLRGSSMNVDIVASVPKLEKTASLQGIRKVSGAGAVSFDELQLSGDKSVRKEIIARYLVAEENENDARDLSVLALTPANYRFQFLGSALIDSRPAYRFKLKPRKKREGSFVGDIWIDSETYLPLRENGRVVQHSIFLRRLTLTRSFRIVDNRLALPESTSLDIDTRIAGKAQLIVKLHDLSFTTHGSAAVIPAVQ